MYFQKKIFLGTSKGTGNNILSKHLETLFLLVIFVVYKLESSYFILN